MPPITTMANGRWVWAPIRVENAAGISPKMAVRAVIMMGRKRSREPWTTASSIGLPSKRARWNEDTCKMASITATPKMDLKFKEAAQSRPGDRLA